MCCCVISIGPIAQFRHASEQHLRGLCCCSSLVTVAFEIDYPIHVSSAIHTAFPREQSNKTRRTDNRGGRGHTSTIFKWLIDWVRVCGLSNLLLALKWVQTSTSSRGELNPLVPQAHNCSVIAKRIYLTCDDGQRPPGHYDSDSARHRASTFFSPYSPTSWE